MKVSRFTPVRGKVYTYDQILNELSLQDSAFLRVRLDVPGFSGDYAPIQTEDTDKERESLQGLSFMFIRTTDEWIPIFNCVNTEEEILKAVHVEVYIDNLSEKTENRVSLWVSPKSNPREQFYKLEEGNMVSNIYDEPRPLRKSLVKALEDLKAWKKVKGI